MEFRFAEGSIYPHFPRLDCLDCKAGLGNSHPEPPLDPSLIEDTSVR